MKTSPPNNVGCMFSCEPPLPNEAGVTVAEPSKADVEVTKAFTPLPLVPIP